ncbi:MAG: hypothetical protein GKR92_05330 [Gammaproteobacteria bacterium]|nr:MAG: hypothetical protein GKR92_05330 [Gammaproteobacteria bacterium]
MSEQSREQLNQNRLNKFEERFKKTTSTMNWFIIITIIAFTIMMIK